MPEEKIGSKGEDGRPMRNEANKKALDGWIDANVQIKGSLLHL